MMVRILAFVALVMFGTMTPVLCQDRTPARPADKSVDPAINPLDVPRWMGDTIGHILSGDDGDPPKQEQPSRQ